MEDKLRWTDYVLGQALSSGFGYIFIATFTGITFLFIVIGLSFSFLYRKFNRKERLKRIYENKNVEQLTQNVLDLARAGLNAERLQIVEYTNTIETVAFVPKKFMSCTYESYADGKLPACNTIKNEFTSHYVKFLTKLRLEHCLVLNLHDQQPEYSKNIYDLMDSRNASVSLYVLILDKKTQQALGFVSYDKHGFSEFSAKEAKEMQKLAEELAVHLNLAKWLGR